MFITEGGLVLTWQVSG